MTKQKIAPLILYGLFVLLISYFALIKFIDSRNQDKLPLTIIHTDVLYGKINAELAGDGPYKDEYLGGSAMISSLINDIRLEVKNKDGVSVLLDAGNTLFEGTSAPQKRGKFVIKIMNYMKYDAMNFSNGELDYGVKAFEETVKEANFPILGANITVVNTEQIPDSLKPYVIKNIEGFRIGILGLNNPQMNEICLPERIKGWQFHPYQSYARRYINELKEQNVNFLIVLSDLWDDEREKELAQEFKNDINVIVGISKRIEEVKGPLWVGNIPIIKTSRSVKSVGQFDFIIDKKTKKITYGHWTLHPVVSSKVKPDSQVQTIIAEETQYIEQKINNIVLGQMLTDSPYELFKESAFGNLICDIIKKNVSADVSFINSAALRGHPVGHITEESLNSSIPYDNDVITMELTGFEIKEILEKSFFQVPEYGILQVSGIQLKYDLKRPFGQKIWDIKINGQILDENTVYVVATITYLREGGDNFATFKQGRDIKNYFSLKSMVKQYITQESQITSFIDERMKMKEKPSLSN